jgi:glucose-1-phosphate adenylyltransferase
MRSVLSLILGGGRGTRLFPLTMSRSKPAMPLAGRYRLIDVPISNCINSGVNRMYVLTQFLSVSLHQHISNTYKFDMFDRGFVEILAAQQTNERMDWYQGTADAIRQNLRYVTDEYSDVLILSGDQLYRMDYQDLLRTHRDNEADITMAVLPITRSQAEGLGIARADVGGRIRQFYEKPKAEIDMSAFRVAPEWLQHRGIAAAGRDYLANMGIYVFRRDVLVSLLEKALADVTDFGKHIFPKIVDTHSIHAHLFDGFWEDLGTIRSYHEVSLALTDDQPPFEFFSPHASVYTRVRNLPPSRISGATLDKVRVAEGCVIQEGAIVRRSIVGLRSRVCRGVQLASTVMIGADRIESDADRARNRAEKRIDLGLGDGSIIRGAIIDKDARIGKHVVIDNREQIDNADHSLYYIRDGIVCVPRGTSIPDGTRIPVTK